MIVRKLILLFFLLMACGPNEYQRFDACEHTINALSETFFRCYPEKSQVYYKDIFIKELACSDCNLIIYVRDIDKLYEICLPWLHKVSCTDLSKYPVHPACQNQLEKKEIC